MPMFACSGRWGMQGEQRAEIVKGIIELANDAHMFSIINKMTGKIRVRGVRERTFNNGDHQQCQMLLKSQ